MHRALLLLCVSIPALAQSAPPDTQLTQTLITEIRQLRQDLQLTAATMQRVQIVMYRLQTQAAATQRATQRLDDARNRCADAMQQKTMRTTQIKQAEERVHGAQNPVEKKVAEEVLAHMKSEGELFENEEQQCHSRETEAESQFRTERAKMNDLEDQLDKLDKVLAGIGATPTQKQ
jgi:hypothetical protein